jgi:hypothetical protein
MSDTQESYIPEHDITKKLEDGREVLVAPKGVPMLRSKAVSLGLIKEAQAQGPSEVKAEGEADAGEGEAAPSEGNDQSRRSTPVGTPLPVIKAAGDGGDQGELTVDPTSEIPGTVETTEPVRKKKA